MGIEQGRRVLSSEELLLNGLCSFGHSIGIASGLPLMEHQHKTRAELVIVLKGSLEYKINQKDYIIYEGEALFTPPDAPHFSGETQSEKTEMLWLQIDLAAGEGLLGLSRDEAVFLGRKLLDLNPRKISLSPLLMSKFAETFVLLSKLSFDDKIKGRGLFLFCLAELLTAGDKTIQIPNNIGAVRQYISEHIKEPIDISELLSVSGLTADKLKLRFEHDLNITPRKYIIKAKAESARRMVAMTNRSIIDIAFEYSFPSSRAFCSAFKKYCGYSPKAFRSGYSKGKIEL